MAFHTTGKGEIAPCTASARACPLAPIEDHFHTVREASHALALEALERQTDFQLADLPSDWGKVIPSEAAPVGVTRAPARQVSSLSVADLQNFSRSEANRPAQVKDDWRRTMTDHAATNGDLFADENPDTSVTFGGYYDATPEPDED